LRLICGAYTLLFHILNKPACPPRLGGEKTKAGLLSFFNRKIREKKLPIFTSPPLLVKERGIKGVRFKKP
jgi:hypothetical protein